MPKEDTEEFQLSFTKAELQALLTDHFKKEPNELFLAVLGLDGDDLAQILWLLIRRNRV